MLERDDLGVEYVILSQETGVDFLQLVIGGSDSVVLSSPLDSPQPPQFQSPPHRIHRDKVGKVIDPESES